MTDRLICTACDQPIPNGKAVTTSRLFEQRHWHRDCAPARVPEQRKPMHDDLPNRVRT